MVIGVTGGTGFIGQYLLQNAGESCRFRVLTSNTSNKKRIENDYISYIPGEYCTADYLKAFSGCDAVVHFAGIRSGKEAEQSIANYFSNIRIAEDLFQACKEMHLTNIVNISTTAVYNSKALQVPFREDGGTCALSNYGISKIAVEQLAAYYNSKFGMKIKSLRLAQVLGIGERGGYMPAIFLNRCLNGEKLSVYGTGKAGKEYIYVKDVAAAALKACACPEIKGVFNIGLGRCTSNEELASAYCTAFGNPAGYELLTDKPEVMDRYWMDVTRASEQLGFVPSYSLEEALKDMSRIIASEK